MRDWLIKKLGGYPDIDSAISAIKSKDSNEKYQILTLAVRRLFNTISSNDILKPIDGGEWMCAGKTLKEGDRALLRSEAEILKKMKLWEVLQIDIKYHANLKMFIHSKSEIDLVAGKLSLYNLDVIKTRLESLGKDSAHFNFKEGIGTSK